MNHRQRVMTALQHQEPDMVPLDLGATENTTIARIAYLNLRAHYGMMPDPAPFIINRQMDAVFPQDDLLQRLGIDFRPVRPSSTWKAPTREMADNSFYDELNIRWKKASYYYDMVEHPLHSNTFDEIRSFTWPDTSLPARVAGLREQAKKLHEETDYAIVTGHLTWGPFELGCALRGYDQFCMDFYENPQLAEYLLDKNLELAIGFWDAYLSQVGDYIQVAAQGDDLGMQTGTFISPKMYRKFIKPRHKALFDFIKSKTNAKIFLHSCGSVYDLIPDFIEAGVEILSPVQFSAAKMDLARLKHDFGKELTFWGGGIDTQQMLPKGSLAEIRDQVSQIFDLMAPGGGFVFVPVHNIQSDITPDRIDTVYQTALEKRSYR